jgi:hypothetical protein
VLNPPDSDHDSSQFSPALETQIENWNPQLSIQFSKSKSRTESRPRRFIPPTFDDSTPAGRAEHWRSWYQLAPDWRPLIDPPPCWTCGRPPDGTFSSDGSPRFRPHDEEHNRLTAGEAGQQS